MYRLTRCLHLQAVVYLNLLELGERIFKDVAGSQTNVRWYCPGDELRMLKYGTVPGNYKQVCKDELRWHIWQSREYKINCPDSHGVCCPSVRPSLTHATWVLHGSCLSQHRYFFRSHHHHLRKLSQGEDSAKDGHHSHEAHSEKGIVIGNERSGRAC